MGGRVSPAAADGTPARVWHNFRGLAMARSIGDHNAKAVGVIAEPEVHRVGVKCRGQPRGGLTVYSVSRQVTEYTITPEDSMMILASDGVWEFLSSQARRPQACVCAVSALCAVRCSFGLLRIGEG